MKQLSSYIFEHIVGEIISFESFWRYIQSYANGHYDINVEREKFLDLLTQIFNSKSKKIKNVIDTVVDNYMFYNKVDKMTAEDTQKLYNIFVNTPMSKVNKIVGSGCNAVCFDLGDKILRYPLCGYFTPFEKCFYSLCKTGNYDVFPKIYRLTDKYVVMEKLFVASPKCVKLWKDICSPNCDYYDIPKSDFAIEWKKRVQHALADVWYNYDKTDYYDDLDEMCFGDFTETNIGENKNGEIIYFDI